MNKLLFAKLALIGLASYWSTAQAANLSIQLPNNSNLYTTTVGSFFDARIYVDGLPDFGAFDFKLTYDKLNLSAVSLTSASVFGAADTAIFANDITPGSIHFSEAIADTSTLEAGLNIANPTLLGTVKFKALKTGVNNLLNIDSPLMYSFDGTSFGFSLLPANVTINAAPVPLPASVFLFAPGLLAIFARRKSKITI